MQTPDTLKPDKKEGKPKKCVVCCVHGEPCEQERGSNEKIDEKVAVYVNLSSTKKSDEEMKSESSDTVDSEESEEGTEGDEQPGEKGEELKGMKRMKASEFGKQPKRALKKAEIENKDGDSDVKSDDRETMKEKKNRQRNKKNKHSKKSRNRSKSSKAEFLSNHSIKKKDFKSAPKPYLGILGWQEAEQAVSGKGELGIYHRIEKTMNLDLLEPSLSLCLVYRCPLSIYRHHKILGSNSEPDKIVIKNSEHKKEIYDSLDDLIDHYRKIVKADSSQ